MRTPRLFFHSSNECSRFILKIAQFPSLLNPLLSISIALLHATKITMDYIQLLEVFSCLGIPVEVIIYPRLPEEIEVLARSNIIKNNNVL